MESILFASRRPLLASRIRRILESAEFHAEPEIVRPDRLSLAVEGRQRHLVVIDGESATLWKEIRKALASAPHSIFVLCCGTITPGTVQSAIASGIHGLISVHAPVEQAAHALVQICNGERRMCFDGAGEGRPHDLLTPSESKVLALAARGYRNAQIARELGSSEGSVRVHIHNLLRKTGAKSRDELAKALPDYPEPVSHVAPEIEPEWFTGLAEPFDSAWMFGAMELNKTALEEA